MSKFIFSGFADEISPDFDEQLKLLNELGIKYLELRGAYGKNVSEFSDEMLDRLSEKLEKSGIGVSAIGSPVGKYEITEDYSIQLERFCRIIDIAKKMKTRYIRIFSYFMKPCDFEKYKDEVIRRLFGFVKIAENEDIILLHENEKDIFGENAENCKYIFDNIKSPNLKGIFDPANFVQCGVDTLKAFELLKEHIVYMHIKDALPNGEVVPAGMGIGHLPEIFGRLNADGYEGFVSLEPHLGFFNGLGELEQGEIKQKTASDADKFKLAYRKTEEIIRSVQNEKA